MPLLRSEIPSGMCAKLRTVAASSNRDHPTRSLSSSPLASTINCSPGSQALLEVTHQDHSIGITLLLLVRATYIMVLFFTHIPFVVNHTINATPPERLQHTHARVPGLVCATVWEWWCDLPEAVNSHDRIVTAAPASTLCTNDHGLSGSGLRELFCSATPFS